MSVTLDIPDDVLAGFFVDRTLETRALEIVGE
jgi:hypothetical protein